MSRLRTYAPMRRQSQKVITAQADFRVAYRVVDARSEGRCECSLMPHVEGWALRFRCHRRASDHHHLYKPRRSHHDPALIVHLCRHHHDRCEWPYKRGRLVVSLVGGRFSFAIRFAADKFSARA